MIEYMYKCVHMCMKAKGQHWLFVRCHPPCFLTGYLSDPRLTNVLEWLSTSFRDPPLSSLLVIGLLVHSITPGLAEL